MRDELMPGQKLAAYWIEHVLRHNGTKHLQLTSKNLPFYQRYLLDVIAFLVAIVLGLLLLVSAVLYFLLRRCFSNEGDSKEKKTKKERKDKGKAKIN